MAEILPNQPVIFDEVLDCHLLPSNIVMLAQYGDITQFQMALEPCGSDFDVLNNGNFDGEDGWTLGTGWSIADGQACHEDGLYGTISQVAPASNGVLVRLTFTLSVSSLGCVIQYGTWIENFTQSGSYTRWIVADSASVFGIAATGAVCISNLQIITVNTDFSVTIVDSTNTPVITLDTADGYFNFEDGYFTASIDWETLAIDDGCYTLVVVDPCPCSQRGIIALDFVTSLTAWEIQDSAWTIAGGNAVYSGSASRQARLDNVVCDEVTYIVSYTLSGMGAGEEFTFRLGGNDGVTRNADGTYTELITSGGTDLALIGDGNGSPQTFTLSGVSIEAQTPYEYIQSNVIKVSSTDFGCKTYLLSLCNDSDGLGFGFDNTGFAPNFRIEASLVRGTYPSVRNAYDFSNGRKSTTYGRMRVARELGLDLPPHLVDFMALTPLADHFYIDGEEYFVEDDEFPSVSWDDNVAQGGFALNVSKKTQLIENRRLSSSIRGCSINGNPILTEQGFEITTETGVTITTDG